MPADLTVSEKQTGALSRPARVRADSFVQAVVAGESLAEGSWMHVGSQRSRTCSSEPAKSIRESSHDDFCRLVDELSSPLLRFAFRLTGQMAAAEDLVQETYEQAWRGIDGLREPAAAPAWMFRILRNRYARWVKRQRRVSVSSLTDDHVQTCEDMTADVQRQINDQDELQVALAQLDDRFKMPLLLVVMEERSVEEVSRILRLRRGTVLSRVHRAKEKLGRIIADLRESNSMQSNESRTGNRYTAQSQADA